jgi:hypothetical protein
MELKNGANQKALLKILQPFYKLFCAVSGEYFVWPSRHITFKFMYHRNITESVILGAQFLLSVHLHWDLPNFRWVGYVACVGVKVNMYRRVWGRHHLKTLAEKIR